MRGIFSVVGLLVVLAIVGVLASRQLTPAAAPQPAAPGAVTAPTGTPQQQVDQVRKAAEAAVLTPRAMPEDIKN